MASKSGKASKGGKGKAPASAVPAESVVERLDTPAVEQPAAGQPVAQTAAERLAELKRQAAALESQLAAERAADLEKERQQRETAEAALDGRFDLLLDSIATFKGKRRVDAEREACAGLLKELAGLLRVRKVRAGNGGGGRKAMPLALTPGSRFVMRKRSAEMVVEPDGTLVVVAGVARLANPTDEKRKGTAKLQQELVDGGFLDGEGRVVKPFQASSHSTAARILLGGQSANGAEHWRAA